MYIILFTLDLLLIIVNRCINGFSNILWISDFSSFFGILNVIFTAKHTVWGLIFNLISTCFISVTSIIQHLWLNAISCIAINIPSLLFGIIKWRKNEKSGNASNLNKLSNKSRAIAFILFVIISTTMLFVMKHFNGNLYYLDSFYSISLIYGVVLCSFAYIDQFKYFIFSNVLGIAMYVVLTIQNINNLPVLFTTAIYLIVNISGYLNWIKLQKQSELNKNDKINENLISNNEI